MRRLPPTRRRTRSRRNRGRTRSLAGPLQSGQSPADPTAPSSTACTDAAAATSSRRYATHRATQPSESRSLPGTQSSTSSRCKPSRTSTASFRWLRIFRNAVSGEWRRSARVAASLGSALLLGARRGRSRALADARRQARPLAVCSRTASLTCRRLRSAITVATRSSSDSSQGAASRRSERASA